MINKLTLVIKFRRLEVVGVEILHVCLPQLNTVNEYYHNRVTFTNSLTSTIRINDTQRLGRTSLL